MLFYSANHWFLLETSSLDVSYVQYLSTLQTKSSLACFIPLPRLFSFSEKGGFYQGRCATPTDDGEDRRNDEGARENARSCCIFG